MPRCARCGEDNPPGAARCSVCGSPLVATPADRKISVLVVDLHGFDPASGGGRAPDAGDVDAAGALARREIRRLGGAFPDPGDHLAVGVFGAPVARSDATERAVRAALRVRDAIQDLGRPRIAARAGVHTGTYPLAAVPATVGLDSPEMEVPADAVRAAAGLAPDDDAGVGIVVVDDATYDEARDLFEFVLAGHPLVREAQAARGRFGVDIELNIPTPFIGRGHELALLTDVYTRVLIESSPHVVTVVGAAGTGKSRLLSEFWNVLDARPELVYWRQGRSLGGDPGVTLWAVGEVVKGQAGILESDDVRAASEKLDVTLRTVLPDEEEARRVGALVAPLAGLMPEEPRPVAWSVSFPAWLRFLEAVAATHPMVLVFEDLHLADPGTLAFVQHVSEHATAVPLLVVCTARLEVLDRQRPW
ncbi:MAG TPA: AAA family ATPase, partial [Actinomycetota bacterium]|nr:AAA family ATPase [Actinomycetota bacterium]